MKKGIRLRYAVAALAVALTGAVLLPINNASAEEIVDYAGIEPGTSTPKEKFVDVDAIVRYYQDKGESATERQKEDPVQKEALKDAFKASLKVNALWQKLGADSSDSGSAAFKDFKSKATSMLAWVDSVGRATSGGNESLYNKVLVNAKTLFLSQVSASTKNLIKEIATTLEQNKGSVEEGKKEKYQQVLDKLKGIGDSSAPVNLDDPDLAEYVGLGNTLTKDPNAVIKLPGESDVDPEKAPAEEALRQKIAEIDKVLTANSAGSNNFKPGEREALERAKQDAQGVLDAAASKTTKDLKDATTAADTALQKANGQITANKQQAKSDLDAAIQKSNTLVADKDLPESAKQDLNAAIQKANQAKAGDPTVKQLEDAKAALDQAYAKAEQAKNQAVADKAQAKATAKQALTDKIAEIQKVLDTNAADGKNLSDEQRRALEDAKKAAQGVLATADNPGTTADTLKQATTTADGALQKANGQIAANKQQAKSDLDASVQKSNTLASDKNLPEADKQKLNTAIQDATKVKDNGDSTVKQLEDAKTTLDSAYAKAEEAKNQALANEAQAKEAAKQALTNKIAEIERLLSENPADGKNLKSEERQALEQAKAEAQKVLDAVDSKTAADLTQATNTANTALEKAKGQVTTNKEAAKSALGEKVTEATGLVDSLPESAKQDLRDAIAAATQVKDKPDSTVKQLEDAKTTLEAAIAKAKAAAEAEAKAQETAKQKLTAKIEELKQLLDANPDDSRNLKPEEREALQQAKDTATAALMASPTKSAEELNQATEAADQALQKAKGQIATNKDTAKGELEPVVTKANQLSSDPMLSPSAKEKLDNAIKQAETVKNSADSTVKQLDEAKAALEKAYAEAEQAKAQALADEAKAKEAAKQNLTDKIAELEKALKENPAESQNLSPEERQALEQAKRDAEAVLADVDNKNSKELGQAVTAADQALQTANTAVTENKNTAKGVLDPEITKAEEVAAEEGIPAEAKTALDEAIAAAKKITTDNTVSEIKAAKEALDTAVANAKAAKTKAEHDAAKAELAAKLEDINEVLKANPEASKNLGEAERAELEKAKANLEALLENADSKPASELKEASTQADTALEAAKANVADNQGNAKEKLAAAITEATKVSDDKDLPAEAKKALDEAIAKAEAVKEDPNASVAAIEEATAKLAEAKEQATKARDEAVAAKEAAKKALGDKIAEIDKVLNANPEEGKNLTSAERQALEAAKAQAEAVLKAADTKTTDELNAATAEADQALNQAKGNVTKNQDISRKELLAALAQAKALSEAPLLPADAKKALDEAIAKAQAVYDDPAATVSALEEAKETLLQAYQVGETAHKNAIAEKFRKDHAEVLAKTVDTVTLDDYAKVESALADYAKLGPEVQKLLGKEKATLDALKQKLDALKAQPKVQTGEKLSNTGTEASVVLLVSLLLTLLGASGVVAKKKLTA